MPVHKIFHGQASSPELLAFARQKLGVTRQLARSAGLNNFSRVFDASPFGFVRIVIAGDQEFLHMWGGGAYFSFGSPTFNGSDVRGMFSGDARGQFIDIGGISDGAGIDYVGQGGILLLEFTDADTASLSLARTLLSFSEQIAVGVSRPTLGIARLALPSEGSVVDGAPSYGVAYNKFVGPGPSNDVQQVSLAYTYTKDFGASWQLTEVQPPSNKAFSHNIPLRVSPTKLWSLAATVDLGSLELDTPVVYLWSDNGSFVTELPSGDIGADFDSSPGDPGLSEMNDVIASTLVLRSDVEDDTLFVITRMPNTDGYRVYKGSVNAGGFAFVTTLPDPTSGLYSSGSAFMVGAYVQDSELFVQIAANTGGDPQRLYNGGVDGTSWSSIELPWASYDTGEILPQGPTTLFCTRFNREEGRYELQVSRDKGASWSFRAVVRSDAGNVDPGSNDANVVRSLLEYAFVLTTRDDNGRVADVFPGQPWVGDNAITPPFDQE